MERNACRRPPSGKEELAATLEDLRATRAELVERLHFAMLSELSAGVGSRTQRRDSSIARGWALREDAEAVMASRAPGAAAVP